VVNTTEAVVDIPIASLAHANKRIDRRNAAQPPR
jgi:hypothetical protein